MRECLEELNMHVEFVRSLGTIQHKSKWNYKGKEFWVYDDIEVVLVEFVGYGKNKRLGVKGEFIEGDVPVEISKEEMLSSVYEFVKAGIKL